MFPEYVAHGNDFNSAVSILKSKSLLTEAAGGVVTMNNSQPNWFSIFNTNLKEAVEGLNILTDVVSLSLLKDIHLLLQEKLKNKISFITLLEKGVFYNDNNSSSLIPTHIRSIADVSGAGDTVIAVASLVYAATKNVKLKIIK